MTCWSTLESIDAWVRETNNPELSFNPDSVRMFHEVFIRNTLVLQWQRGGNGRDLLVFDLSRREEVFLRQRFSGFATISRPPRPAGAATLSLRTVHELSAVLDLLTVRLTGDEIETTTVYEGRWGSFSYWAERFHTWEDFDSFERDYKLQIATRLERARASLRDESPDWLRTLKRAFQSPNNLTSWRMHSEFLKWCELHPDAAKAALNQIWEENDHRRIRSFLRGVPASVVSGPGLRLSLASFLQMAIDPCSWPFYRSTLFESGFELTGFPAPASESDEQSTYDHAMLFLDRICEEANARGLVLRDRLDAQSVLWTVAAWDPVESWTQEDKSAFYSYRGQRPPEADKS
jgi:hypothetical protein